MYNKEKYKIAIDFMKNHPNFLNGIVPNYEDYKDSVNLYERKRIRNHPLSLEIKKKKNLTSKKWIRNNRKWFNEWHRKWAKKNKDKVNASARKWYKTKGGQEYALRRYGERYNKGHEVLFDNPFECPTA